MKAEGVVGMARAFLSVGAQSVLISLWKVPDESANTILLSIFGQWTTQPASLTKINSVLEMFCQVLTLCALVRISDDWERS